MRNELNGIILGLIIETHKVLNSTLNWIIDRCVFGVSACVLVCRGRMVYFGKFPGQFFKHKIMNWLWHSLQMTIHVFAFKSDNGTAID